MMRIRISLSLFDLGLDPDPTFNFDADPYPAPHRSDADLITWDHWATDPPLIRGPVLSLKASIVSVHGTS